MGRVRTSRLAGEGDGVAAADALAGLHVEAREVRVAGEDSEAVVDHHGVSVAALEATEDHHSVRGGLDLGPDRGGDVEAGVEVLQAGERVEAGGEGRGGRAGGRAGGGGRGEAGRLVLAQ